MIDETRQSLTRFQSRYELDFSIQLQIDGAIDIAVIYLPRLRSSRNAIHSSQYAIALQFLMQLIGVIETGRQSGRGREWERERERRRALFVSIGSYCDKLSSTQSDHNSNKPQSIHY